MLLARRSRVAVAAATRAFASATAAPESAAGAPPNALERFLVDKIKVSGPITVAEYMKTAVASSSVGYYGKHSDEKKVFGDEGDFITAPELTQLFGEMIGIWCYHELGMTGHKGAWNLVECGPGTGQLASDLLRVFEKFGEKDVSLHLIEASDALIDAQEETLCGQKTSNTTTPKEGQNWVRANQSRDGVAVYWYKNIDDLPDGFTVFIANEFLDALPVHCFEKEAGKEAWCEKYIGLDGKNRLRFVRSKGENIHTQGLIPVEIRSDTSRTSWECTPDAGVVMHQVADRVSSHGGFALFIDYGHDGSRKEPSFRAYSKHKQVDPLSAPGEIDLTADVDFGHMRRVLEGAPVAIYGPHTQREFLAQLGIGVRLRRLIESCKERQKQEELIKSYNMLMGDMGERFLAMSIFPQTLQPLIRRRGGAPAGFNGAPGAEAGADEAPADAPPTQ
ncbi:hypothetical protein PFISCL1PPCAC_11265 [Pristionchus fissidentatus]|uniref:Protein arginine methyltransferase NDUFAF7 n=1 Tax=Pristionchus fissidentatus TaxID=1538716 RepID=A0AAV5VKR7_9BILA|nr:hypothetical protein PFISCL1PPCAC_11265 [Pristionchus fissidentatus]